MILILAKVGPATRAAIAALPIVAPNFGTDIDCTIRGIVSLLFAIVIDVRGAR